MQNLADFSAWIAQPPRERQELGGALEKFTAGGSAAHGDAAAPTELEQAAHVPEYSKGPQHGVAVDAEDGREVARRWEAVG